MICPKCGGEYSHVPDSEKRNGTVWRKRCCYDCNEQFHTIEISKAKFDELDNCGLFLKAIDIQLQLFKKIRRAN